MLTDLNPGHRRVDGLELAANLVRCLGLHVEGVVLPEAAAEQDQDHRPRPSGRPAPRGRRAPGREQSRQPHAQIPGETYLNATASRHSRVTWRFRLEMSHVRRPPG